jgi:hypothetical protein
MRHGARTYPGIKEKDIKRLWNKSFVEAVCRLLMDPLAEEPWLAFLAMPKVLFYQPPPPETRMCWSDR